MFRVLQNSKSALWHAKQPLQQYNCLFRCQPRSPPRQQQERLLTSTATARPVPSLPSYPQHFLSCILSGFLAPYWERSPTSEAAIAEIEAWLPTSTIGFDHVAFRTYGDIDHLGIPSVSTLFQDLGYTEGGAFEFEKKKLRARWFKPPHPLLPRLFVSELKVKELPPEAQRIIRRIAAPHADVLGKYGITTGFFGLPPWENLITSHEYKVLAGVSEYAAWVSVNGYALNHTTIAVHRLEGLQGGIAALNSHLTKQGIALSKEGGETKVSPDGLLLQSSTVADTIEVTLADGETMTVPGSYIEFAERLVLPEYAHVPGDQIDEHHRRDGFEAASADKIFESTTAAAKKLGVV